MLLAKAVTQIHRPAFHESQTTIVALLFLSIGLGVALFLLYKIRDEEQVKADQRRIELQTDRDKIRTTLDEQRKVNYSLESALTNRVEETKSLSLNLTNVVTNLTVTASNLVDTKAKLAVTETKLAKVETEAKRVLGAKRGDKELREIPIPAEKRIGWRVEEEFVNAIRGREKITRTNFEDGVRYMEFTDAVNESAGTGQRVTL